jgi:hypothetical protein
MSFCEPGNELSGSVKWWEFLQCLSSCWFLKKLHGLCMFQKDNNTWFIILTKDGRSSILSYSIVSWLPRHSKAKQ